MDNKYNKLNNTYLIPVKSDPRDSISVILGDDKEPDIILPQAKICRWDNESNVSIRLKDFNEYSVTEDGGKVIFGDEKKEVHFYQIEDGEGANEIEVILKEKPQSNIIEFTLEDKDVEYFYQPELTQEEITKGRQRPENVIGSYAIYSSEEKINYVGDKEYKCGKVGHIYRPKIVDSIGNEVWGELHIENKTLSVAIPQEFLDKAVYPVRHAAGLTFGYTSAGGTYRNLLLDQIQLYKFALSESANITSISIYGDTASTAKNYKSLIYDDDGTGAIPGTLLATSDVASMTTTTKWHVSTISASLSAGDIFLGLVSADRTYPKYDSVAGMGKYNITAGNYTTPLNPYVHSENDNNTKLSIYATYINQGNLQISASGDDAYSDADGGNGSITSIFGVLGWSGGWNKEVWNGLRFQNVAIPQGSTITSAVLTLREHDTYTGSGNPDVDIYGEDVDNSAVFTADANNITGRTLTTAVVAWNPTQPTNDTDFSSPDISSVIQEIVDRGSWTSGNSLSLITKGTGNNTGPTYIYFESFDKDAGTAPRLAITYTEGGTSTSTSSTSSSTSTTTNTTTSTSSTSSSTSHSTSSTSSSTSHSTSSTSTSLTTSTSTSSTSHSTSSSVSTSSTSSSTSVSTSSTSSSTSTSTTSTSHSTSLSTSSTSSSVSTSSTSTSQTDTTTSTSSSISTSSTSISTSSSTSSTSQSTSLSTSSTSQSTSSSTSSTSQSTSSSISTSSTSQSTSSSTSSTSQSTSSSTSTSSTSLSTSISTSSTSQSTSSSISSSTSSTSQSTSSSISTSSTSISSSTSLTTSTSTSSTSISTSSTSTSTTTVLPSYPIKPKGGVVLTKSKGVVIIKKNSGSIKRNRFISKIIKVK